MQKRSISHLAAGFTLGAGIVGLILRLWLFLFGFDESRLPVAGHPANLCCWLLAAAGFIGIFLITRTLPAHPQHREEFPSSGAALPANLVAAGGLLYGTWLDLQSRRDVFSLIVAAVAVAAAAGLIVFAVNIRKGQSASLVFSLPLNLYFILHLISQYRRWSWISSAQIYGFPLLASVMLMLACYQRTALFCGLASPRTYLRFSYFAALFCFLSIPGPNWCYYLCMSIWMLTSPYRLFVPPKQESISQ